MSVNANPVNFGAINGLSQPADTGVIFTTPDFAPTVPLSHARILYNNKAQTVAGSSEESATFSADATLSHFTYEYWRPAAMPATLTYQLGLMQIINAIGLGAHTLGSSGASVSAEYSADGGVTWQSIAITASPERNDAMLMLFNPVTANAVRLSFTGASTFSLSVVYIGKTLDMYRAMYSGQKPDTLSRNTTIKPNRSVRGALLGWSTIRNGYSVQWRWDLTPLDWYRQNVDPFAVSAQTRPFFVAWNPVEAPEDCVLAWTTKDITPSISGRLNWVDFDVSGEAVGNNLR